MELPELKARLIRLIEQCDDAQTLKAQLSAMELKARKVPYPWYSPEALKEAVAQAEKDIEQGSTYSMDEVHRIMHYW